MENDVIQKVKIANLDFENPFFDSLRDDYPGFNSWLSRKGGEDAYVLVDNNQLLGFLYLKDEKEADDSIIPSFDMRRRLKIGTFKIDSHGTVLGQRFLSIILRKMLNDGHDFTYVTLFPKQTGLVNLFEKFGFRQWGTKSNGELVYFKDLAVLNDIYKDFHNYYEDDDGEIVREDPLHEYLFDLSIDEKVKFILDDDSISSRYLKQMLEQNVYCFEYDW